MATLIPSLGSLLRHAKMTSSERRFAQRLESHLEDDYLCWYDVPVGSKPLYPDFIVLNPRRGILVLEVKNWRLETILSIDKMTATIRTDRGPKTVANPLEQARQYAQAVHQVLERDPALAHGPESRLKGQLVFPWGFGVVLPNITRSALQNPAYDAELRNILPPERVLCKDEMTEAASPEDFQKRLWGMFGVTFACTLTLPQVDRVRWHLFPEIRVGSGQASLGLEAGPAGSAGERIPDLVRIMDLQQEQLARSLGEGHRVIHGVAGSGKTMILGYRAQHLVKAVKKPILLLCYNVALAARLRHMIAQQDLAEHVSVYTFHAWCREQLRLYHLPLPQGEGDAFAQALVETVVAGVEKTQIPRAQYGAVLIDEAHDFESAWLQLVVQMVDPETNSLLVLYDDAQSLYGAGKRAGFSFARVGIEARGRTTILRLNYRNTAEVLALASEFAREILTPAEAGEDGIPLVSPESAGRHGPLPEVLGFPDFQSESRFVVERLRDLHEGGVAWGDMAVVYRMNFIGERLVEALREARLPVAWLGRGASQAKFRPDEDCVKVMTMHAAKGLEFPVVIVPGVGYLPHSKNEPSAEARLLYVAMTRATERLILSYHADSPFALRLQEAVRKVA